jgi:hypothetical protein
VHPLYVHGHYSKKTIHYCIEPNCKNIVSGFRKRCKSHAKQLKYHKFDCQCAWCKAKRGGYNGENNPNFDNHKLKGENNSNFKGWKTELYQLIRVLPEYKIWRKEVFERDKYICQECNYDKGKILEVHHKKTFSKILEEFMFTYSQFSPIEDKETLIRLSITYQPFWDVNNGITLCKPCHEEKKKCKT